MTTVGVIKGDTGSLDYGSCRDLNISLVYPICNSPPIVGPKT